MGRLRNKTIDMIVNALDKIGVDKSLTSALPVALKLKPAERGPFAQAALDFGEETFSNHIADLNARIANNDNETAERAQAVAGAEEALGVAEKTMNEKSEDLQIASDLLKATKTSRDEADREAMQADIKIEELTKAVVCEREGLAHTQELLVKFGELRERQTVKETVC